MPFAVGVFVVVPGGELWGLWSSLGVVVMKPVATSELFSFTTPVPKPGFVVIDREKQLSRSTDPRHQLWVLACHSQKYQILFHVSAPRVDHKSLPNIFGWTRRTHALSYTSHECTYRTFPLASLGREPLRGRV